MAKAQNKNGSYLDRTSIMNTLTDEDQQQTIAAAFNSLIAWTMSGGERYSTVGRTRDGSAILISLKDGTNVEYYYSFSNSLQTALVVVEIFNEVEEALSTPQQPTNPPKSSKR